MTSETALFAKLSRDPVDLAASRVQALLLLWEAYASSEAAGSEAWEFALSMPLFQTTNCSESAIRWLVCKGYAEHRREVTRPSSPRRRFRPCAHLCFSDRSCFVMTAAGADYLRAVGPQAPRPMHALAEVDLGAEPVPVPTWDPDRRTLSLGPHVVKCFRQPAPDQELILAAFEEEDWPPRVMDPLPPQRERDAKKRLHETIGRLNRHQKQPRIRFRGDGTGQGVLWEPAAPGSARGAAERPLQRHEHGA